MIIIRFKKVTFHSMFRILEIQPYVHGLECRQGGRMWIVSDSPAGCQRAIESWCEQGPRPRPGTWC